MLWCIRVMLELVSRTIRVLTTSSKSELLQNVSHMTRNNTTTTYASDISIRVDKNWLTGIVGLGGLNVWRFRGCADVIFFVQYKRRSWWFLFTTMDHSRNIFLLIRYSLAVRSKKESNSTSFDTEILVIISKPFNLEFPWITSCSCRTEYRTMLLVVIISRRLRSSEIWREWKGLSDFKIDRNCGFPVLLV